MKRACVGYLGVDTGGTFTDVVAYSNTGELVRAFKLPSQPKSPDQAILQGLAEAGLESFHLSHGTTVATNALLERKGTPIALVTTAGFRDILVIGRGTRAQLYSLHPWRPRPLVPPEHCFEALERIAADGTVLVPLENPEALADAVLATGVQTVAVTLLFSYVNPAHELQLGKVLRERGLEVVLSHQVCPEYREYERASTTCLSAYLQAPLRQYLRPLAKASKKQGAQSFWVVHSGGAVVGPDEAGDNAVLTVLSGPAAGVRAAWHLAQQAGYKDIVTFDMGGTSTDVALCSGGMPLVSEGVVDGFPVRQMMVDIHTVGAGGGSIAHIDEGGALQVGPRSAGADPGPAAYGRGELPTVTDAHVLLGRLPDALAGGRLRLAKDRSLAALFPLAMRLGTDLVEASQGIVDVANAHMEKALRVISVEKGHDPRRLTLVPYGGAGPIHACELADRLNCRRVLVLPRPGLLCALGAMLSPWLREFSHSVLRPLDTVSDWEALFAPCEAQAKKKRAKCKRLVDLRYQGQGAPLTLPFSKKLADDFEKAHLRLFTYVRKNTPIELVAVRVRCEVARRAPRTEPPVGAGHPAPQPGNLSWHGESLSCPRWERSQFPVGHRLKGPALVLQDDCTTLIPPGWKAVVDEFGNLVVEKA